jgi:hypothetical protein
MGASWKRIILILDATSRSHGDDEHAEYRLPRSIAIDHAFGRHSEGATHLNCVGAVPSGA